MDIRHCPNCGEILEWEPCESCMKSGKILTASGLLMTCPLCDGAGGVYWCPNCNKEFDGYWGKKELKRLWTNI